MEDCRPPVDLVESWVAPVRQEDLRPVCCRACGVSVRDDRPCFVLHNILSKDECQQIVKHFSQFHSSEPESMTPGARSQFCVPDSNLSSTIWGRVSQFFPETLDGGKLVGLQQEWRHAMYFPGQSVMAHMDFRRADAPRLESRISFTVYLNEDFGGGETTFVQGVDDFGYYSSVVHDNVPKTGSVIVFYQDVPEFFHCAKVVTSGRKFIMRADVMYQFPEFH